MSHFRPAGLGVVFLSVAVPLVWFVPLAADRDPLAVMSQYFGSAALILMGLSQLMATRWRGVEAVFGGLDRVYVLHKWIGIAALALVLLHDTIDAEMRGLTPVPVLEEVAETAGELSLYGFLILVVLSIATFVPYHLWRWTHRFIGGFFALSAFHFVFIAKPFSMGDPLGLYVGAFCFAGLVAYAYTILPLRRSAAERPYKVAGVQHSGGAVIVDLAPQKRGVRHRAGQFAFLRLQVDGLTEPHPFTISSAPDDAGLLRFSIKASGDWTGRLARQVAVGQEAAVEGPYGKFTRDNGSDPQIWIAAGIGVTPFLAWAGALPEKSPQVHWFYCVRSDAEAPHLAEIMAVAEAHPAITLHLAVSSKSGRLSSAAIEQAAGADLRRTQVYFCGPSSMRESLQHDLKGLGLPHSRFHFEEFEMRSGVGLRRLADWLTERFKNQRSNAGSGKAAG